MPRANHATNPARHVVALHGLPREVKLNFRPRNYRGRPYISSDPEFYGTLKLQEFGGVYKGSCRLNASTRRSPSYLFVEGKVILDEDKAYLELTLDSDFEHNICAEVTIRHADGPDTYETLFYNVPVTAEGDLTFITKASNGECHYEGSLKVTDPNHPDHDSGTLKVILLAQLPAPFPSF